jgi:hypothetical protein
MADYFTDFVLPALPSLIKTQIGKRLTLGARITRTEGANVNVGEEFDVAFTISNTFLRSEQACFRKVKLVLESSEYATLIDGTPMELDITDELWGGTIIQRKGVRFRAEKMIPADFGGRAGLDMSEPYVRATLKAEFDLVHFFSQVEVTEVFHTQVMEAD